MSEYYLRIGNLVMAIDQLNLYGELHRYIPVLAAWGFDYYKMGKATGRLVVRILEGEKPETIPTIFMTDESDVDLLINLDVAEALTCWTRGGFGSATVRASITSSAWAWP